MRMLMKNCRRLARGLAVRLALGLATVSAGLPAVAEESAGSGLTAGEVAGAVMLRGEGVGGLARVRAGMRLPDGNVAVVTSTGARVELLAEDGGRWRIGSLALWMPMPTGGRLLAGTALVEVPPGGGRAVDSTTGRVVLGEGLWMVQAVENEGLKLICLDGPAEVVAGGGVEPAGDKPERRRLRPGELIFLRPGGREFGPVVTVFLQELLATSRLVNGFAEPLPQARRLQNLALAQSERLKGVTNAFVGGARDEDGFQLVVPPAAGSGVPKRKPDDAAKPDGPR